MDDLPRYEQEQTIVLRVGYIRRIAREKMAFGNCVSVFTHGRYGKTEQLDAAAGSLEMPTVNSAFS